MPTPNLNNPTRVEGKVAVLVVTTTPTDIVVNAADSNTTVRINTLSVSNVNGATAGSVNISVYRSATEYFLAKTVSINPDESYSVFDRYMYLEPGDSLRITADAVEKIQAVCAYEIIS
ncbi:MAG: hypothetical protein EBU08_04075 [Micrococcales bacterium]|nr:hypothetical protein [Micrococcales bacterium]